MCVRRFRPSGERHLHMRPNEEVTAMMDPYEMQLMQEQDTALEIDEDERPWMVDDIEEVR